MQLTQNHWHRFLAQEQRDQERQSDADAVVQTSTEESNNGDGAGDTNAEAGINNVLTVRDLDSGYTNACFREFTARVPEPDSQVPYSLAHFLDINQNVIREIIHIGLQQFEDIPRAPDSYNYIKHRSNTTFNKWFKLMQAIGFCDFDVEIAKFQHFCKGLVEDMKVADTVACCSDFVINEFLNYVGANRYWLVKGEPMLHQLSFANCVLLF